MKPPQTYNNEKKLSYETTKWLSYNFHNYYDCLLGVKYKPAKATRANGHKLCTKLGIMHHLYSLMLFSFMLIIKWFGFERDTKDHSDPTPVLWAGTPSTKAGCSEPPSNLALNIWWSIHNFSQQPFPVLHHPSSKEFLPYIYTKSTLF